MTSATIDHIENKGDCLSVVWSDGYSGLFHAMWLRDNAPDASARDPGNGQKLFDITDIAADTVIAQAAVDGPALSIAFAPDGHVTRFDGGWLHGHCQQASDTVSHRQLWGAELAEAMPVHDHDTVMADPDAKRAWLTDIRDLGFALMTGAPTAPGTVLDVAASFGYVRKTNYGRFFEVRTEPQPINLAYTPMGLSCHTDNPYRDPVPGLQLLHCLVSENDGGESVVVDGYKAADILRHEAPDAFALLTRHAVPFRFASADAVLETRAQLITLDDRGNVKEVRFNNRSIGAFDLPADVMPAFYKAYRHFAEVLQRPDLQVGFKAGPGDLFIVDNQRVLHGRNAVRGEGRRHLQGCYADKDSLRSTLRLLERDAA